MTIEIRGLSLLQPWASLMALGEKGVETRSRRTSYRGFVAIAASARWRSEQGALPNAELAVYDDDFVWAWQKHGVRKMADLPLGCIVAIGPLTNCVPTDSFDFTAPYCGERERAFGNYSPGRFAWTFDYMLALEDPIPVKGSLGLYRLPDDVSGRLCALLQNKGLLHV